MEAKAKYAFKGVNADELSMEQGEIVKILDISSTDWYPAEKNGRTGVVPATYVNMKPHEWYLGKITRKESEPILLETDKSGRHKYEDGAFLVRNSEGGVCGFALSIKCENSVQHIKILSTDTGLYHTWTKQFRSVTELVKFYKTNNVGRNSDTVLLLKEMSECEMNRAVTAIGRYNFTAGSSEELSFHKGDRLVITDQSDHDWYTAELNGRSGFVPSTYITFEK